MAARQPARRKPAGPTGPVKPKAVTPRKRATKPSADVIPFDSEGFFQEFGPSDEHLLAGKSIVVLVLNRRTGEVEIDDALSTPTEAASMCLTASAKLNGAVDRLNGLYED